MKDKEMYDALVLRGWSETLARVQKFDPKAILGGGALRDLDLDRPVSDLDIFVSADVDLDALRAEIETTHPVLAAMATNDYVTWQPEIVASYKFETNTAPDAPALPINIVLVQPGECSIEKQLARFDFGICQIAWDGSFCPFTGLAEVRTTLLYEIDKAAQQFSLVRFGGPEVTDRGLRRFERISQKYPGWKLVRPAHPKNQDIL